MKNKLTPAILMILLLMPVSHAQEDWIGGIADSIGYAVDSAINDVRIFLTFDARDKVDLNLEIADKKVNQIAELSKKGNMNLVETVKHDYKKTIDEIKNTITKDETIKSNVAEGIIEHKAKASSAKISVETKTAISLEEVDAKASELSSIAKAGNPGTTSREKAHGLVEGLKKDLQEFVSQARQNQSEFQLVVQQYLQYAGMLLSQVYAHGSIADTSFNQGDYMGAYEEALIAGNLLAEVKVLIKQAGEKEREMATKPMILVQPPDIRYFDSMEAEITISNVGGKPLVISKMACEVCVINLTVPVTLGKDEKITVPIVFTEKYRVARWLEILSNDRNIRIPVQYMIIKNLEEIVRDGNLESMEGQGEDKSVAEPFIQEVVERTRKSADAKEKCWGDVLSRKFVNGNLVSSSLSTECALLNKTGNSIIIRYSNGTKVLNETQPSPFDISNYAEFKNYWNSRGYEPECFETWGPHSRTTDLTKDAVCYAGTDLGEFLEEIKMSDITEVRYYAYEITYTHSSTEGRRSP